MIHSGFNRFNKDDDEKKNVIKEVDAEGNEKGIAALPIDKQLGTDWTKEFNDFNNGGGEPVTTPFPHSRPHRSQSPSAGDAEHTGEGNGNGAVTDTGTGNGNETATDTDTGTSDLQQKTLLDTQIAEVWNQITSRQPFSYDMNGDALYQQYADIYQNNANLAMQNAMAQSAALTGGYGNSYAQAAGQQAYAQQMQNLNDVGMELYDRAHGEYQAEGQELYNQLATLYGFSQDKEAIDQWHAINGDFEYDDKGNIIGLKGGEAEAAAEAANPNTTYQLGGVMNGKEVPKQLANVGGLTTTNVELFDSTGKLYNAAKVSVDRKNGYDNPSIDDKITYNLGGKEITLARGYSPYTRDMHPDAINGTFNGYQPNNVASYYDGDVKAGMLSKTGDSTEMNGRDVPIYATPDGKEWVYDAANNIYLEFEQKKEENKEN
jgi:hypothetical protein